MAITFVGFYRPNYREEDVEIVRKNGQFLPEMREKIKAFPSSLPTTCKLIGSWGVSGGEAPGVMVVEADNFSDIQFINIYYAGWLNFDWHPTNTGGVPRE